MAGDDRQGLIAYNIGVTRERLNQSQEALDALREFMRRSPPTQPERADAQELISELEARLRVTGLPVGEVLSPAGPIVMGVGGAALLAGIITGIVALDQASTLHSRCGGSVCPPSEASAVSDISLVSGATDVLIFAGGGAVVAGLILTLVLRDRVSSERSVAVACGTSACLLVANGVFQ